MEALSPTLDREIECLFVASRVAVPDAALSVSGSSRGSWDHGVISLSETSVESSDEAPADFDLEETDNDVLVSSSEMDEDESLDHYSDFSFGDDERVIAFEEEFYCARDAQRAKKNDWRQRGHSMSPKDKKIVFKTPEEVQRGVEKRREEKARKAARRTAKAERLAGLDEKEAASVMAASRPKKLAKNKRPTQEHLAYERRRRELARERKEKEVEETRRGIEVARFVRWQLGRAAAAATDNVAPYTAPAPRVPDVIAQGNDAAASAALAAGAEVRRTLTSTRTQLHLASEAQLQVLARELQFRDITPEDYSLLLLLDNSVAPKTAGGSFVDSLPSRILGAKEDIVCAVCLDHIPEGQTVRTLPCGHEFHTACIRQWLTASSNRCPADGIELT